MIILAQRSNATTSQQQAEALTKRQERAQRILDVAAELILRWGYKKTTIDDIAKQAGVAKGTIYLHWKTREDLFMALVMREGLTAILEVLQRLLEDPQGIMISHTTRHAVSVVMTRPLAKALFIRNVDVFGELLQSKQATLLQISQQKSLVYEDWFELLRGKGLLRTDMSMPAQLYAYSGIVVGFLTIDPYLPESYQLPLEQALDTLAETIRRTFEPDEAPDPASLREVSATMQGLFKQYMEQIEQMLQKELE
jgi:AcrR family transcriptional regulator